MRRYRLALLFILIIILAILPIFYFYVLRANPGPAPVFPAPPQQSAPFTAATPNAVPVNFASAADALFAAGFPDPRGCLYCQVDIHTGDVWRGDAGILTVHAFLLPEAPAVQKSQEHFAIAWNGLLYPVGKIGPAADFRADVAALLAEDQKRIEKDRAEHPGFVRRPRLFSGNDERATASERSILPIKAVLLYRLGEPALAQKVLDGYYGDASGGGPLPTVDLFPTLAGDWLWYMFDRAVTAHMRADDRLSWMDASRLSTLGPSLGKTCEDRHAPQPQNFGNSKDVHPFFRFLEVVPKLLADEARRNASPADLKSPLPDRRPKRIAALIGRLEEVSARQMGQPGYVILSEDPIVEALIKEGSEAVEPLITCLQSDKRLTRSVGFGRDFHRDRTLIPVSSAALVCLREILQHPFELDHSLPQDQAREKLIKEVKTAAASFTPGPLQTRAFDQLANDSATPEDWTNAAIILAVPENWRVSLGERAPGSAIITPSTPPALTGPPKLIGESLRARRAPSVGDLLAKRLKQAGSSAYYRNAFFIAKALAAWDGKAHLADLREFCDTVAPLTNDREYEIQSIVPLVGELFADRIALKDPEAPAKYAAWIQSVPRRRVSFDSIEAFHAMGMVPDDPEIQAAATALFDSSDTDWNPALRIWPGGPDCGEKIVASPLLRVPAFQRQIIRVLADATPIGSSTPGPDGKPRLAVGSIPKPGDDKVLSFPVSDFCAMQLSRVMGFPRWDDSLSDPDKEKLRREMMDYVSQYGPNVAYVCEYGTFDLVFATPVIAFPALDHPASTEEVATHRAIFSLPADSHPTQVAIKFPFAVSWPKSPGRQLQSSGPTGFVTDHTGLVWQAEECTENGVKKRYYGFVGYGCIAKVPAEETGPSPYSR